MPAGERPYFAWQLERREEFYQIIIKSIVTICRNAGFGSKIKHKSR